MEENNKMIRTLVNAITMVINEVKDEVLSEVLDEVNKSIITAKQGYTIKEFSTITGITINGVKGRIKRKTLRAVKDGNVYLIPKDEVDRYTTMLKTA